MMVPMTTDPHVPVVQAERHALCDSLLELGPDAPTLCDPWRTRDLAAHLVLREHQPVLAIGIWFAPLEGAMERGQAQIAAGDYAALVEKVRSGPPWWSPTRLARVDALSTPSSRRPPRGRPARRRAVGPRREVPERTARAVLVALQRSASLMFRRARGRGAPRRARRRADHRRAGDAVVTVTGEPVELLLLAYGRMRVAAVELEGSPEDVETLRNARLGVS